MKLSDTLLEYVYCFVESLDSNAVLGLDLTGSISDSCCGGSQHDWMLVAMNRLTASCFIVSKLVLLRVCGFTLTATAGCEQTGALVTS